MYIVIRNKNWKLCVTQIFVIGDYVPNMWQNLIGYNIW